MRRTRVRRLVGQLVMAVGPPLLTPWACSLYEGGIGLVDPDGTLDGGMDAPSSDVALGSDARPDAPVDPRDDAQSDARNGDEQCRAVCTAAGGTCEAGTCVITCRENEKCTNRCPNAPVPCKMNCIGTGACDTVTCTNCEVRCEGHQACANEISCSGPGCAILCCGAEDACNNEVSCNGPGCNIVCDPSACNGTRCEGRACADAGRTCD